MATQTQLQNHSSLDEMDLRIERGEDTDAENGLYAVGVLNVLNILKKSKKFQRPRGKNMPIFTEAEATLLAQFLFFKHPAIRLKVYKRIPPYRELPARRQLFIKFLFEDAHLNRAKAARMAGYSVRSAKQIAYHIMRQP